MKELLSKVGSWLMEPVDVLTGRKVIDAQRAIIDIDRRIIALHEENRRVTDRMLELANEHIKVLEKKADLQSLLIDALKATSNYEPEEASDE